MTRLASSRRRSGARGPRARRGIALFISMFFVAGIGALALSAIYLTANASLLSKTYEKEDDLKYASEAALQIGKSELNFNPAALPNTSYVQLMKTNRCHGDGATVPGVVGESVRRSERVRRADSSAASPASSRKRATRTGPDSCAGSS